MAYLFLGLEVAALAVPGRMGAQILANPLEDLSRNADLIRKKAALREEQREEIAQKERKFVERYNELIKALSAFSTKYKDSHVIDVRAVESVRKAYRRLEEADSWFKAGPE